MSLAFTIGWPPSAGSEVREVLYVSAEANRVAAAERAAERADARAEARIVARAVSGDADSFRRLVERYRNPAFAIALRIVSSREEAEEAAQDAFLRAWRALPRFRGECRFATWLFRIVTRCALDRMWEHQREDGGWTWLDDNEPPSEIEEHYGVTMAAIGAGIAPADYKKTPVAKEGLEKIRKYLRNNAPANAHNRAMKSNGDSTMALVPSFHIRFMS